LSFRDWDNIWFVDKVNDFVLDQVDQRDHAFDRVRVAVVLGVLAPIGHAADEAAAFFNVAVEVPRRERIDLNQLDVLVGETAALHGTPPAGIRLDDIADLEDFLDGDRRLPVGIRLGQVFMPCGYRPAAKVHRRHMGRTGFAIKQCCAGTSGQPERRTPANDVGLCRLRKLHMGKAGIRAKLFLGFEDLARQRHLCIGQRIEWVPGDSRDFSCRTARACHDEIRLGRWDRKN
jgi:hypothetical protein